MKAIYGLLAALAVILSLVFPAPPVSAFVSPGVQPPPPRPTPPACAPDCREHHAAEPLGVVEDAPAWGGVKVINWLAVDYQAGPK